MTDLTCILVNVLFNYLINLVVNISLRLSIERSAFLIGAHLREMEERIRMTGSW